MMTRGEVSTEARIHKFALHNEGPLPKQQDRTMMDEVPQQVHSISDLCANI